MCYALYVNVGYYRMISMAFIAATSLITATLFLFLFLGQSLCTDDDPSFYPGHLEPLGARHNKSSVKTLFTFPKPLQFFQNFVSASFPLLIKGGAKLSPAFTQWTDEYFVSYPDSDNFFWSTLRMERKRNEQKAIYNESLLNSSWGVTETKIFTWWTVSPNLFSKYKNKSYIHWWYCLQKIFILSWLRSFSCLFLMCIRQFRFIVIQLSALPPFLHLPSNTLITRANQFLPSRDKIPMFVTRSSTN